MKLIVKKANRKLFILGFQQGHSRALVAAIVSFFVAGLVYWFVFVPSNQNAWIHQGPLLIRDGAEVLFRMPNHDKQENFYVPLDEPFISHKKDRNRYELVLYGQTSERLNINKAYERRIGVYKTKEEARKHYHEVLDFLVSDLAIFDELSQEEEQDIFLGNQLLEYSPFFLASLLAFYFLFVPVVGAQLILDREGKRLVLIRRSLLVPKTKTLDLADFESASLDREGKEEEELFCRLNLNFKGGKKLLFCQYKPPYEDDKLIASLSQHTRLINWWNDDELLEKYGDTFLNKED